MAGCSLNPAPTESPVAETTPGETAVPTLEPTPTPFKAELVICTSNEPDQLIEFDYAVADSTYAMVTAQAVIYSPDFQAQPGILAVLPNEADSSLIQNDDGTLTVTLHYRDNLKWSDGEPFKAADAILGFKMPAMPGAPYAEVLDARESDPDSVVVILAPGAEYPYVPSQPPLPAHKRAAAPAPAPLDIDPHMLVGEPSLGPYYLAEWAPGSHMLLQANPNNPIASIPVVRIRFIADRNQAIAELGSGTCDVVLDDLLGIDQLPPLDQGASANTLRAYKFGSSVRDQIVLNTFTTTRVPYFASTLVRQAIAYGFNRAGAVQNMYGGLSAPTDGWIPSGHWAAGGGGFGGYAFDAGRASSLLDQAGWMDQDGDGIREYHVTGGDYTCQRGAWVVPDKTPLSPVLILPDNDGRRVELARQIQAELKAIGVNLQLQAGSPAALFAPDGPIQRRDFDLALISMAVGPDPDGVSQWVGADVFRHPLDKSIVHRWQLEERWLESEQLVERLGLNNIPGPDNDWQGQNYAGWCSEPADIAAVQASLGFDLNARKSAYAQLEAAIAADVPVIPLAYRPRLAASKPYVCGIQPVPFEPLTWNAAAWSFDPQGACSP